MVISLKQLTKRYGAQTAVDALSFEIPAGQIVATSGDVALDRAAYGGITASKPFPPLPTEFGGQYLALRFHFYYNPDKNEMQ